MTAHSVYWPDIAIFPRDRRKKPYVLCSGCGEKHPSVDCPKLRKSPTTTTTIGGTHA